MRKLIATTLAFGLVVSVYAQPATPPAGASRLGSGYLKPGEGPDSGKLLPPPPAEGSKALARDKKGEAAALKLQGTARWTMAAVDADLFTPDAIAVMSCAAGRNLGPQATPKTDALLKKAAADLGMSSYPLNRYTSDRVRFWAMANQSVHRK